MTMHQIAYRYAKALFQLTLANQELEITLERLQEWVKLLNDHSRLSQFFSSPRYSIAEKKPVLEKLLKGKISPGLLSFLSLLLDKGRLSYLPEIVKEYQHMVADHLKSLEVTVLTVIPMEPEAKKKLRNKLKHAYQREIVIKEALDPHMIGGVKIVINNHMMDFSIKNRLLELKETLLAIPV